MKLEVSIYEDNIRQPVVSVRGSKPKDVVQAYLDVKKGLTIKEISKAIKEKKQ